MLQKENEIVLFDFKQSITVLQIYNICMILSVGPRGVRVGAIAVSTA